MTDVFLYPVPHFTSSYDVMLVDPTVRARTGHRPPDRPPILVPEHICPVHDPGLCRRVQGRGGWYCVPVRPVARSLLSDLRERYGAAEGNKVYLAMRHNRQGPFAPGAKYGDTVEPPTERQD